ncbi:MAG: 1-acyl-sn-glycerol-3-phosphate acyltransferase [Phycisphaerales bacterium]|nr:1-acyl-sn-glycerol-3-phosphate acyltransferase [Phycisphaerales bacterium]
MPPEIEHITPIYRLGRFLCIWFSILVFRVRTFGRHHVPRTGGVLILSNHQSFIDPPLVGCGLPRACHFMARDTLFRNPLFGRIISAVNSFPVQRGSADIGAIKEALRRLKKGRILVMFPEGTRTPDGHIGALLPGLAAIAQKARVPIVPALVDGVYQAWPRHQLLPSIGNVVVLYDRPIEPDEYKNLSAEQLTTMIRRRMVALQEHLYQRQPARKPSWHNGAKL